MNDSDPRIDRRTILGGVGVGMIGLAGCLDDDEAADDGGDGEEPMDDEAADDADGGEPEGSISVTGVWSGGEEEDFLAVAEYVEQETNLDITYHPRTTEALLTGTLMDYESGVAPADIVVIPSPARVRSDAGNGHLEAVGDTWDPESYAPDPEQVSVDGEVYAAPFKMDLKPGFWYRESFFEEHDLTEPESYDEFLDLLDEISGIEGVDAPIASGNGDGWPLSDVTEAFFLQQEDGDQLQQDLITGDASFTDDRVYAAFEEIQRLLQEGYFSQTRDFGVQYEYFWENELPLYFQGSFTPGFEAIQDPEDLGVFRLPETNGMVASVNWFTVPAYSENVDAARTALERFVSAEGQQVWAERGGFIASSLDVPDDAYELDIMVRLTEMADEVTIVPDLDDALGDPFQSEFWAQLTGLWAAPDSDIDTIVEQLDAVLQETVPDEE